MNATAAQRTLHRIVATVELDMLPPMSLSKNSRRHWSVKHRDFQYVKTLAWAQLYEQRGLRVFPALEMQITWRCVAPLPDDDNVLARCAAIRDAAEAVGLVSNDKHVRVVAPDIQRVAHKHEQRCIVTFCEGEL